MTDADKPLSELSIAEIDSLDTETLLDHLHETVEKGGITLDIIDLPGEGMTVTVEFERGMGAYVTTEESKMIDEFIDRCEELIIELYEIDQQYETWSLEWAWNCGRLIHNSDLNNGTLAHFLEHVLDFTDDNTTQTTSVYRKVSDPETLDVDTNTTSKSRLTRFFTAVEDQGEAEQIIDLVDGIPPQRDISIWNKARQRDSPTTQEIAEIVCQKCEREHGFTKQYQCDKVRLTYRLLGETPPSESEIEEAVDAVADS